MSQHRRVHIIYIAVVDLQTLEPVRKLIAGRALPTISAWEDEIGLIDNTVL